MAPPIGGVKLGSVPFTEASEFFRQKLRLPTSGWTDIWQGMHSRAFVVAGAKSDALLEDFQQSLQRAIDSGAILDDFRKDFDTIVARHGWSHKGSPGWRSRVIFQTNLRTAHAAGRWAQIERLKDRRPYLRYVAVMDNRTRPLHAAWHGTVLPVDDPWWRTHFPPNGWNCRCTVQSLSERDLKRFGYKVSPSAPPSPTVQKVVRTVNGPVVVDTPQGIDPGFAYNPGIAWRGNPLPTRLDDRGVWPSLDAPDVEAPPLPRLRPQALPADFAELRDAASARAQFVEQYGASAVFTDPLGIRVEAGETLLRYIDQKPDGRARSLGLIASIIEKPAEVWVGFETVPGTGRVVLKRRYVRIFLLGRGRGFVMVAQFERGTFEAFNLIPKDLRGINSERVRSGTLLYRDPDQVDPEG